MIDFENRINEVEVVDATNGTVRYFKDNCVTFHDSEKGKDVSSSNHLSLTFLSTN